MCVTEKRNKKEIVSNNVCLVAEDHDMSKRGVIELMSAHIIAQGESLDYNLSVMTTKRRTDAWRTASGEKLLNWLHHKVQDHKHFILQWDQKMLKPLKHSAQKKEHVAVLLNCVDTGEENLVSIQHIDGSSTAENESQLITKELENLKMNKHKIIGFVFDNTSVNSGIHSGIIVRLERYFGRKLLLFA